MDKFYTRPDIAAQYANDIMERRSTADVLFVEPSAGNGSFYNVLIKGGQDCRAVDIDPQAPGITRQDFLTCNTRVFFDQHEHIVVIGNPPC